MCRGGSIIFFLSTSGSCRMLGSPGLRSDLGGLIRLKPMLLSSSAIPHTKKAGILCVPMLLTKKEAHHFKVNTDDPIVFVVLQ